MSDHEHTEIDSPFYSFALDDATTAQIMAAMLELYWQLDDECGHRAFQKQQALQANIHLMVHQIEGHNTPPEPGTVLDMVISQAVTGCLSENVYLRDDTDPVMLALAAVDMNDVHELHAPFKFHKKRLVEALIEHGYYAHTPVNELMRETKQVLTDFCYWAAQNVKSQRGGERDLG